MRTIDIEKVGSELSTLINETDSIEEDIGIVGKDGHVVAVVIKEEMAKWEFGKGLVENKDNKTDV